MVNRNWVGRCSFILVGFVLSVSSCAGPERLTEPSPGASEVQTWQAEDRSIVGMWTTGASAKEVDDAEADNGAWLLFKAEAPGDFIEFTLPDVLPGRYTLQIRYKALLSRPTPRSCWGSRDEAPAPSLK